MYPPLRLIVACCNILLILHPPVVTSPRLSGKKFLCHVLMLLHKTIVFLVFPLNLNVMNKKSDIAAER